METRANYLLIGIFTTLGILGAFGFFIWLAKVQIDQRYAYYDVVFESVSGLSRAGDVRFAGLSVGQVVALGLYEDDPGKVVARVEIAAEAPIRTDTVAQLQAQGLTGVAFVSLTGGSPDAPLLKPAEDGTVPVIFAQRSVVQALLEEAPDLLVEVVALMRSLGALASPENQAHLTSILVNLEDASADLRSLIAKGDSTMDAATVTFETANGMIATDIAPALADFRTAAAAFSDLMATVNTDVPEITQEAKTALQRASTALNRLDVAIAGTARPIRSFAEDGLPQYTRLARDMRELVESLQRLSARMERDPARFLFGDRPSEFRR